MSRHLPCTSSPWQGWDPHHGWDTRKTSSWTPPCWGHCIYFHVALSVTLDFTAGSDLFASSGWMLFCFVPFMHFCTDIGVPPPLFITTSQHHVLWRWSMLQHVGMAGCSLSPWFLGQTGLLLQLLETWVWLSWRLLPKVLCRFCVLNLPVSVTDCSASAELGVSKVGAKQ